VTERTRTDARDIMACSLLCCISTGLVIIEVITIAAIIDVVELLLCGVELPWRGGRGRRRRRRRRRRSFTSG